MKSRKNLPMQQMQMQEGMQKQTSLSFRTATLTPNNLHSVLELELDLKGETVVEVVERGTHL